MSRPGPIASMSPNILRLAGPALLSAALVSAQEDEPPSRIAAASGIPLRIDIARRDLRNFLEEEKALAPYRIADDTVADLRDAFTIVSVDAPHALFWDARSCRLLGILDLDAASKQAEAASPSGAAPQAADAVGQSEDKDDGAGENEDAEPSPPPSPYLFKAAGRHPLAESPGATGEPEYFGFRLVEGRPEFLYRSGRLAVEERIWLEDGGRILRQRFALVGAPSEIHIAVPKELREVAEASVGEWKDDTLVVPNDKAEEILLSYSLFPEEIPETDEDQEPAGEDAKNETGKPNDESKKEERD